MCYDFYVLHLHLPFPEAFNQQCVGHSVEDNKQKKIRCFSLD